MTEPVTPNFVPGLEGVVAAQTRLSSVDGQAGELIIAGFPVEELAGRASFEETVYLLWHNTLPDIRQLADFQQALVAQRGLSPITLDLLRFAARRKVAAIDALRMAAGTLNLNVPDDPEQQALALVASFPTPGIVPIGSPGRTDGSGSAGRVQAWPETANEC